MAKDEAQILVRLPPKLKDKVTKRANAERRSVNAQIIVALEEHVATATSK